LPEFLIIVSNTGISVDTGVELKPYWPLMDRWNITVERVDSDVQYIHDQMSADIIVLPLSSTCAKKKSSSTPNP